MTNPPTPATPAEDAAFYGAMTTENPCIDGSPEYRQWVIAAINGRANQNPPTDRYTSAYYEGWHWGREWAAKAEEVALEVAEFAEWYDHETLDEDLSNEH